MKGPDVTIAVPVFNDEQWLGKTVGSILGQSYQHLKIVLAVDVSADNSADLTKHLAAKSSASDILFAISTKAFWET
ncbi:MAG: glycosyltransferase [Proteobacteria bacterium]|nr:glycosyltransferase [Pseudomonadota bacterium]